MFHCHDFALLRACWRLVKRNLTKTSQRRVVIGPHMSALFMNYDLVWFQIHEMLRIEGEGEEQLQDELQVMLLQQFDAGCDAEMSSRHTIP
jgi:hypothetical protein